MGGKDSTSNRIENLLGRMIEADSIPRTDGNQAPQRDQQQQTPQEPQKPQDPMRWEEYKNRPREFDDIEFAKRQDEEQRRSELRGGS